VLKDVSDASSRIPRITRPEFDRLCADGTISGGMIPKLQESFDVLKHGAKSVVIIGKLSPGQLEDAVTNPGSAGTVLEP
jgi:acetylglutamate kinase